MQLHPITKPRFLTMCATLGLLLYVVGAWAQCRLVVSQQDLATLRQQAASGKAEAQCGLGMMYEAGLGVHKDSSKAALWLRKAAEQGVAPAQFDLGELYYHGQGVPQDDKQAAVWFRKAAEQNFSPAQYALGALCTQGRGVPQDNEEAYFWFDLAAAGKMDAKMMETAAKTRDETASHLTPADLSRVQERAREWFEDHAAKSQ
jgi:TPR repeat protein